MSHCSQAILNRLSRLRAEEAKLDRDIARTQLQTRDVLVRKAERRVLDDAVLQAAQEVLDSFFVVQAASAARGQPAPGSEWLNLSTAVRFHIE
jgi:hypothetical protein